MRELDPVAVRALAGSVRGDAWRAPDAELVRALKNAPIDQVDTAARRHRVAPFVVSALRNGDLADTPLFRRLEPAHRAVVSRQLHAAADLAALASSLGGAGVPWLVFKGPVLAHLAYPRPDLRTYEDVDVLVPRHAFADAVAALESEGFLVLDRNWSLIRREARGQLHLVHDAGTAVDLHWHLLNRESVRRAFRIDMSALHERAREIQIDGLSVRTLDPVDTLAHVCLHAALSGAGRLQWLKDVDLLVRGGDVAWDALAARARAWNASVPVGMMLARATEVLGTPPSTTRLRSRGRGALDAVVERRWPLAATVPPVTPATVWAETQRDGAVVTLAALARRMSRKPLASIRALGDRPREGAGAVLVPDGTRADRDAFLRDVAAAAR
jgi:hypothetical protein